METFGQKLSFRLKFAYGAAYIGDTAIFNILTVYALFFLTDVAEINPTLAGSVIFIATVWNTIFIVIIGYVSDRYSFKKGRRLPYMYASILPMLILLVLMFTVISGTDTVKAVYYTVINTALWTAHSTYLVSHEALGAELSHDSAERTSLRSYARFFMGGGNLVGVVFILYLTGLFQQLGGTEKMAWQTTALIVAVMSGISLLASCIVVDKEMGAAKCACSSKKNNMLREYFEVLKLKPLRYLLFVTLCFSVANSFFSSDMIYFMKYNLGMSNEKTTVTFLVLAVSGILFTPLLAGISKMLDKKQIMEIVFWAVGGVMILFGLAGIQSFGMLCIYIVIFNAGASVYWQLYYSIIYDVCEVDEYQNGRRREAVIMSISKIVLKLSAAFAVQGFAVLLKIYGYDAEQAVKPQSVLEGTAISLTYLPAALLLLAAIALHFYPLSQKKHRELVDSLQARSMQRNG